MTKAKGRKNSKIRKLIEKQTPEQREQFSFQIESLLENELAMTIECKMNAHKKLIARRLGMNEDDILNEVRVAVWKGLLSFKKHGKAKLTTYLNHCIENCFCDMLDKVNTKKHSSVDYYADIFKASSLDHSAMRTDDTGESLYASREEFMRSLSGLTTTEQRICIDLIFGYDLEEMAQRHRLNVVEVTGAVNRIDSFIQNYRKKFS